MLFRILFISLIALLSTTRIGTAEPSDSLFENLFKAKKISYFSAREFLVTGKANGCKDAKRFPPKRTWCNAFALAKVIDEFRKTWKHPVIIESAYLSPEYIKCVGAKIEASYSEFRAVDFRSKHGTPKEWILVLEKFRSDGMFEGQIEIRSNLVHIELIQSPDLWIYTGKKPRDGVFYSPFFSIKAVPVPGQILENPKTDMNLHSSPPKIEKGSWIWAERISYLKKNLVFVVDRLNELSDSSTGDVHYWAGGRIQFSGSTVTVAENNNWFVVVESHIDEENALEHAEELKTSHPDFSFEIYRDVYGKYAIVTGANLNQADAKKRVLEARCAGISKKDAFIWPSKNWVKLE